MNSIAFFKSSYSELLLRKKKYFHVINDPVIFNNINYLKIKIQKKKQSLIHYSVITIILLYFIYISYNGFDNT